MNAKLTALGLFVVATLALPAHAESQSAWLLKQMSQTDGSTTTFGNQSATDSRTGEAKKSDVKKVTSPAEDQSEWFRKQLSQSDGHTGYEYKPATDSRFAKAKQGDVKRIAGPLEAAMSGTPDSTDGNEAAPKRKSRLPVDPDFPVSP